MLEDGTIGALATGKLWKYVLPAGDAVTTAGYFTKDTGLGATDIILVVDLTNKKYGYYILAEAEGVLTATQMSEVA